MAAISRPAVLLLDEHTAALDPHNAQIVTDLTRRFVAEYALTALSVTHDMRRALEESDRLVMMHEGKIVVDVSGEEKAGLGVSELVELFSRARKEVCAEDELLLGAGA